MRIRLVLIDNDSVTKSRVRCRLLGRNDFEVIGELSSVDEASKKLRFLRPDAILVNVDSMKSGLSAIAPLFALPARPLVVFLAVHRQYALQAFDLGAIDYLLKPICDDRLDASLTRIQNRFNSTHPTERLTAPDALSGTPPSLLPGAAHGSIAISDRNRTRVIASTEIEWIGAAGDYAEIHLGGTTHLLREPLSALLERLPSQIFCRIHRSFIVNLTKVSGFKTLRNKDLLVRMNDKTVLRASRTFSYGLKQAMGQVCVLR